MQTIARRRGYRVTRSRSMVRKRFCVYYSLSCFSLSNLWEKRTILPNFSFPSCVLLLLLLVLIIARYRTGFGGKIHVSFLRWRWRRRKRRCGGESERASCSSSRANDKLVSRDMLFLCVVNDSLSHILKVARWGRGRCYGRWRYSSF